MARIRTVKPDFFTSEDIVDLSPMARLLYIALWCEADREGRMLWKPRTFKMRYFPAESCDIEQLAGELLRADLVRLYGEGLAYIPTFHKHQHLNPREAASVIPPPEIDACPTRDDASVTVNDAQGGREGKGKERKEEGRVPDGTPPRASRLAADWSLPCDYRAEALRIAAEAGKRVDPKREAEKFRDYWTAKAGKDAAKADWLATWRNWIRRACENAPAAGVAPTLGDDL